MTIRDLMGISVDPAAMFDVQIKRIHEHKRQLPNILEAAALATEIRGNPTADWTSRVRNLRRQGGGFLSYRQDDHQPDQRHRGGDQPRSKAALASRSAASARRSGHRCSKPWPPRQHPSTDTRERPTASSASAARIRASAFANAALRASISSGSAMPRRTAHPTGFVAPFGLQVSHPAAAGRRVYCGWRQSKWGGRSLLPPVLSGHRRSSRG